MSGDYNFFQNSNQFLKKFLSQIVTRPNDEKAINVAVHTVLNLRDTRKRMPRKKRKTTHNLKVTKPNKLKIISAKLAKKLNYYKIPKSLKYSQYAQLHALWRSYAHTYLGLDKFKQTPKSSMQQQNNRLNFDEALHVKILKMDYHGALIKVVSCDRGKTCSSLLGQTGIVVMETKNAFKIVRRDDKVKTIPKAGCHFALLVDSHLVTIEGNSILLKPHMRTCKKFKMHIR